MRVSKPLLPLVIVVLFATMAVITIFTNETNSLTKINIYTQLIYTFVTTILVILTYSTLKATQEQKHQAVRPYLILSDLEIYPNERGQFQHDIDFNVYNEGLGLALNIHVQVKRKSDGKVIYKGEYTRLNLQDNQIYGVLSQIRNEINLIRNNGANGTYYSPYIPYNIAIEAPVEGDIKSYLCLVVELSFSDIYGKKYINLFDLTLDEEELEVNECIEKFEEV